MSETPYVPGGFAKGGRTPPPSALSDSIPALIAEGGAISLLDPGPSRPWRIVRMILGILGIVALLQFIVVMTLAFTLAGSVVSRLGGVAEPTPDVGLTGCPYVDPADCGG